MSKYIRFNISEFVKEYRHLDYGEAEYNAELQHLQNQALRVAALKAEGRTPTSWELDEAAMYDLLKDISYEHFIQIYEGNAEDLYTVVGHNGFECKMSVIEYFNQIFWDMIWDCDIDDTDYPGDTDSNIEVMGQ